MWRPEGTHTATRARCDGARAAGNYDILDGPISNAAWIETLEDWELLPELLKQPSELWYYSGEAPPGPVRAGAGAAAASTSGERRAVPAW